MLTIVEYKVQTPPSRKMYVLVENGVTEERAIVGA